MTRWLDSVRYLPAMSMTADVRVDSVTARDLKTRLGHETTSSLSRYRYEAPEPSFAGLKCLTGSEEYCSRGVATPRSFYYERFARSPLLPNGFLPLTGFAYDIDATINTHTLAKLEERLGPERFARVWTSPEPLDRAIPKEAGVSLTALLRDVLLERYGPVRSTPWPDPIEWAVLLGVVAAATGIMVFARRRRTLLA
jgi:hypothetical protein